MKRVGNLIAAATSYDSLLTAWRKARKGRGRSHDVLRFERDLDANLVSIADDLRYGRYDWGAFRTFKIFDPKEREISSPPFRDRVAQHALFNACEPIFNGRQVENSCACRVGKGQTRALQLAQRYSSCGGYFLKMDVRKYFASIDRELLKRMLARVIKDGYVVKAFYDAIDSFKPCETRGIPLGSLASQFFANHYLTPLDYFAYNDLRVRRYVRYMDDFIVWNEERRTLKDVAVEIERFLQTRLNLTLKPCVMKRVTSGLPFLGMTVYPRQLRLGSRARLRFRRKYNEIITLFDEGALTELELAQRACALFAHVARADSRAFRLRVIADGERRRTARTA